MVKSLNDIEDSLSFGRLIHACLCDIADVYPLIPAVGATFPFIVYRRSALEQTDGKDGFISEKLSMELSVVAADYAQSLDMACRARKAMARLKFTASAAFNIACVRLIDANEVVEADGADAAYMQILTYQITIE